MYSTITKKDYEILKEVYSQSSDPIKDKLINLSCWNLFDVAHLEEDIIPVGLVNGIPTCLHNSKIKQFKIYNKVAQTGDIICISSTGQAHSVPSEYVGRYYLCSGTKNYDGDKKAYLNAYDTYSNNQNSYEIILPQECYLVVELDDVVI